MQLSIIIPCHNEAQTINKVIAKTKKSCKHLNHEILVVDNNSTDNTAQKARQTGAKIIKEPQQGYGAAIKAGLNKAKGTYSLILDGDNTYDATGIPHFYNYATKGYDFVIGNRFVSKKTRKAMPWLHYHLGNPLLSGLARILFKSNVKDAHCGMRLINTKKAKELQLSSHGMEFATEMVIKAAKQQLRTKQLGIPYHKRITKSKLNTWQDGWQHLRFMLLFSPTTLFLIPGILLAITGLTIMLALIRGPITINNITFNTHPMLIGSLLVITGTQLIMSGYFLRVLAVNYFGEHDSLIERIQQHITLEKGLLLGTLAIITTIIIGITIIQQWLTTNQGILDIKTAILAATTGIIGIQILFNSFYFVSIKALTNRI